LIKIIVVAGGKSFVHKSFNELQGLPFHTCLDMLISFKAKRLPSKASADNLKRRTINHLIKIILFSLHDEPALKSADKYKSNEPVYR
jgi:hypothetical protein